MSSEDCNICHRPEDQNHWCPDCWDKLFIGSTRKVYPPQPSEATKKSQGQRVKVRKGKYLGHSGTILERREYKGRPDIPVSYLVRLDCLIDSGRSETRWLKTHYIRIVTQ